MKQKGIWILIAVLCFVAIGVIVWGGEWLIPKQLIVNIPQKNLQTVAPVEETEQQEDETKAPEETMQETEGQHEAGKQETEEQKTEGVEEEPEKQQESERQQEPEKQHETEETEKTVCSLTVRCDILLSKMDKLKKEKQALVPPDGILFQSKQVSFSVGETVYDVLKRELERSGIEFKYKKSAIYNSIYIEGIGGLNEFDCGSSGWMYTVNGTAPLYGSSQYQVEPGDVIEFYYTCR